MATLDEGLLRRRLYFDERGDDATTNENGDDDGNNKDGDDYNNNGQNDDGNNGYDGGTNGDDDGNNVSGGDDDGGNDDAGGNGDHGDFSTPDPPTVNQDYYKPNVRGGSGSDDSDDEGDDSDDEGDDDGNAGGNGHEEDQYFVEEQDDDYSEGDNYQQLSDRDAEIISSRGNYFEPDLPQMDPAYLLPTAKHEMDLDLAMQSVQGISPPKLFGILSIVAIALVFCFCSGGKGSQRSRRKTGRKISYPISGPKRDLPVF